MAASANERGPQRPRFFDWLVNEINSRQYEGLYWLDKNYTTFRISWKHNARKNLVADDYKIFQAWAIVSGKYNETSEDPTRWKTNFRNALRSTKRFELVDECKDPDPHHVYRIISLNPLPTANPPAGTVPPQDNRNEDEGDQEQLDISPYSDKAPSVLYQPTHQIQQDIDVAFGTLSLGNPVPVLTENTAGNGYHSSSDTLQWVLQHSSLNLDQQVSWALTTGEGSGNPTGPSACEQGHAYATPHVDQNGCLLLESRAVNEQVPNSWYEEPSMWPVKTTPKVNSQLASAQLLQHTLQNMPGAVQLNGGEALFGNNCFIENVYMNEEPQGRGVVMNNPITNGYEQPTNQEIVLQQNMFVPPALPLLAEQCLQNNAGTEPLNLDVSIYYRRELVHEAVVGMSSCRFTYKTDSSCAPGGTQTVMFPSPETLPDQKQVKHTLRVLQSTDLLLFKDNGKIYARRCDKCRVFLAFSRQLENMVQHPQPRLLPRDEVTEIFNYATFLQELKDFYHGQRRTSPDYTIYLCFGQKYSLGLSPERKLVWVKLVPKPCKQLLEWAQREGASSLNSETESLQISSSISDLMEFINSYVPLVGEAC